MRPKNVTVSLKNFGPFYKADVEMRPLTVFVGRNSTGKSTLLSLLWALVAAAPSEGEIKRRWGELYKKAESISSAEGAEEFLRASMEAFRGAVAAGLEASLRLAFGVEPGELVKEGEVSAQIAVRGPCGGLHILLTDGVAVDRLDMCIGGEIPLAMASIKRQPLDYIVATVRFLAEETADEYGVLQGSGAVFLPDSRACDLAEGAYANLIDEYRQTRRLAKSAEQLLREVGVELDMSEGLVVRTWSGRRLDIANAPSGVRGVLAIALALSSETVRHIFIDGPETHLHPSAQRLLARAIAEAVNGGKFVALATHSDYVISELNNLIASAQLKPEMVAAYLTRAEGNGVAVERLDVDNAGIPEDEFAKVAEEILATRNELY